MATVQRYVNTASTAGGDGTTNNTSGATRAYASLSEWEAAAGGSATDDYIVDCCGTAADTTAVTVDFATNITTGSVTIRGNASDAAGKYNGTATISTAHYRLAPASGNPLSLNEKNCTVDGIQIEASGGAFFSGIGIGNCVAYTIKNCRIRAASATDSGIGSGGSAATGSTSAKQIINNLIVGFNLYGIEIRTPAFWGSSTEIYNNTIYMDGSGNGLFISDNADSTSTFLFKGNAVANSGASNCFSVTLGGSSITYQDNAAEDSQGTTDEILLSNISTTWTNPGSAQGNDFTVRDASSVIYNALNPSVWTTDITGFTRGAAPVDVGAFEFQSSNSAALSGSALTPGAGTLPPNITIGL
jgi:hypothetical protein